MKRIHQIIEKFKKIHGNKYEYSKFEYAGWNIKSTIICHEHGEFFQTSNNHLSGKGCPKCKFKKLSLLFKFNKNDIIKKFKDIHKNIYDYSSFEYKNCKIKSAIICQKHGIFLQSAECHLRGYGCPKCKFEKLSIERMKGIKEFIKQSNIIHNFKYDYSKFEYKNCKTKGIIICPQHKEFLQVPNHHTNGIGCPKCNSSKGELKIQKWLLDNNIKYEFQKKFDDCKNPKTKHKLEFDFYIPSKNLLIEYDGEQHFKYGGYVGKYQITKKNFKDIQYKDTIKSSYAKQNNIKLLRIKYNQINDINKILDNNFQL